MNKRNKLKLLLAFALPFLCVQCDINYRKGPTRFCESRNSEVSKDRGAFVSYYYAEPFEYQDSVFNMRLVFEEAFTEWGYWYDEEEHKYKLDTIWKKQSFIAVYDTMQTILDEIDTRFYSTPAAPIPIPIKYWVIRNPGSGHTGEGFKGFSFGPGIYGDTVRVPIVANTRYSDTTGTNYSNHIFGSIVFVRKIDTIQ